MIRTYSLLLVVETARKVDKERLDEVVRRVVEYSTARDAIEAGLDAAFPILTVGLGSVHPLTKP